MYRDRDLGGLFEGGFALVGSLLELEKRGLIGNASRRSQLEHDAIRYADCLIADMEEGRAKGGAELAPSRMLDEGRRVLATRVYLRMAAESGNRGEENGG